MCKSRLAFAKGSQAQIKMLAARFMTGIMIHDR
jgi:hypothetical protein